MERKLGIVLDSIPQPVKEALQTASGMGFAQVELPAVRGPVAPAELTRSGRRDLLHHVKGLGLQLAALGGDLGGGGFADSSRLEQRLDQTRAIMAMAAELRVPVVTTHLGHVDEAVLQQGYLSEAIAQLADFSDRTGTRVAFETGGTDPAGLADLLRAVGSPTLGACYDPASLLIEGFEPTRGIEPLADAILIARARDAVAGSARHPGREVPLGEGQLGLAEYLAALDQAGYHGVPFIRRTESEHPLEDLAAARRRLQSILGTGRI